MKSNGTVVLVGGNMGRNDGVDYSARFAADFPDLTFISWEGNTEVLESHIGEADVVIGHVPDRLLSRGIRLRWVSSTGAGADAFCSTAYKARSDLIVTTVSGVHAAAVPEHVLAMLFAFARRLPEQILNQKGPHRFYHPSGMFEVEGQTMGILGLGSIGSALARKARGLGMNVIGWRRSEQQAPIGLLDRQVPHDALGEVLAAADHLVVTLPLTSETRGLLGAREIATMKHTAYLYNVGRGAIVDTDALLNALSTGAIAGAGLDCVEPEPLPPNHPLWDAPNLILSPHYGGLTPKFGDRAYSILAENLRRFISNQPLNNVVDKEAGY